MVNTDSSTTVAIPNASPLKDITTLNETIFATSDQQVQGSTLPESTTLDALPTTEEPTIGNYIHYSNLNSFLTFSFLYHTQARHPDLLCWCECNVITFRVQIEFTLIYIRFQIFTFTAQLTCYIIYLYICHASM